MADITITQANLIPAADGLFNVGIAGEALLAGAPIWWNSATGSWWNSEADSGVADARLAQAIAMNAVSAGQVIGFQCGGALAFGAILTPGTPYYVSKNSGRIAPLADLAGGNAFLIGIARTSSIMDLVFRNSGGTVA